MTKKWKIERTDVVPQDELEIGVPADLYERVRVCENELAEIDKTSFIEMGRLFKDDPKLQATGGNMIKAANRQFTPEQIDIEASIGVGYHYGYMMGLDPEAMCWFDIFAVATTYDLFVEAQRGSSYQIGWLDWEGKDRLRGFPFSDAWLRDFVENASVPNKDDFLFGWCKGVHRFFHNICTLIQCPEVGQHSDPRRN